MSLLKPILVFDFSKIVVTESSESASCFDCRLCVEKVFRGPVIFIIKKINFLSLKKTVVFFFF